MNPKFALTLGIFISFIGALVGSVLFIFIFTDFDYWDGVQKLKQQGSLGKLISLGAVINIIFFFILLKFRKELTARGIVLGTIFLAILTIFL
jgi:mannose/fructose/N-acetylgalactosamine-specific phosphotransferase system component IID